MEHIEEAERPVGNALQHVERIAAPEADIGEMAVADVPERGGDAVEEWLGADEAVVREHVGTVGEVLARSEADFEMKRALVAEQARGGHLTVVRYGNRGKERFDEFGLSLAKPVPARPAIKAVEGGRIALLERCHGAAASESAGAAQGEGTGV